MRRLYLWATVVFWVSIAGFWSTDLWIGQEVPAVEPSVAMVDGPAWAASSASTEPPPISLEEVSRHASPSDCWMAIDGQVFDVTRYVPDHPSEESVLTAWCGREASEAYRTKMKGRHHSARADHLLESLRIGPLDVR